MIHVVNKVNHTGNDQNDTTINFTPFLASTEGRRTQNSVSASINSQSLSPAVSLRNSQTSLKGIFSNIK